MSSRTLLALLALLALAACEQRSTPVPDPAPAPEDPINLGEAPRPAPGATETTLSGSVVEKHDVPSYSYLLLDTGSDKVWAAVPSTGVKVGARVSVEKAILMRGYRSAALKRDFDRVYFGTLAGGPSAHSMHGAPEPTPLPALPVKVPKASGRDAKTVAEVIQQGAKLAGKSVTIRAVVVKQNSKILGKTWIHLRDGSGSEKDKTHDLTATLPETETPKVGDTVVIHGTIATDRDLGSGYKFAVLLEADRVEIAAAQH
jgi:hypothetical protein